MSEERLTRLEAKIDRLTEVVVSLARMEERQTTMFNRLDDCEARQTNLSERVTSIELSNAAKGGFFKWIDRLGALILGGAVALGFKMWGGQ